MIYASMAKRDIINDCLNGRFCGIQDRVNQAKNGRKQNVCIFRLAYLSHTRYLSNFTDNGTQAIASGWRDMTL
jgi:hypothetical protein